MNKKRKTLFDPLGLFVCGVPLYAMFLFIIIFAVWLFQGCINDFHELTLLYKILGPILSCGYVVGVVYLHYSFFGERCLTFLTLYEDRLIWRCPGFRSVTMFYTDIHHIGVASQKETGNIPNVYNGDEATSEYLSHSIYLCTEPFPNEYRHKIHKLHPKEGFVKIPYSEKVAATILEYCPASNAESLIFFHGCMMLAQKERDAISTEKKKRRKKNK